jgi:cyanate permease
MMTAAFGFGQIVGPMIAGYTYDASGSFLLPSLLASVALAAAAALVQIRSPSDL